MAAFASSQTRRDCSKDGRRLPVRDEAACILKSVIALYLGSLGRISIPAKFAQTRSLLRLEEQDGAVTKVEVDEVLSLCMIVSMLILKRAYCQSKVSHTVCDKAAEVPTDNAMPCCALPLVELYGVSIRGER
jgi:hypothetical protein